MNGASNTRHVGETSLRSEAAVGVENVAPQGVDFGLRTPVLRGARKGMADLDRTSGRGLSARPRKGSLGPGGPASPISRKTPGARGTSGGNTGGRTARRALGDITNRKTSTSASVTKAPAYSLGSLSAKAALPFPLLIACDPDPALNLSAECAKGPPKLERRLQLTPLKSKQAAVKPKAKARPPLPPAPLKPNGDVESPEIIPASRPPQLPDPPVLDLGPDLLTEVASRPPTARNTSKLFLFKKSVNADEEEEVVNVDDQIEKPCYNDLDSDDDDDESSSGFSAGVPFNKTLNTVLTAPVSYDKLFPPEQDTLPALN